MAPAATTVVPRASEVDSESDSAASARPMAASITPTSSTETMPVATALSDGLLTMLTPMVDKVDNGIQQAAESQVALSRQIDRVAAELQAFLGASAIPSFSPYAQRLAEVRRRTAAASSTRAVPGSPARGSRRSAAGGGEHASAFTAGERPPVVAWAAAAVHKLIISVSNSLISHTSLERHSRVTRDQTPLSRTSRVSGSLHYEVRCQPVIPFNSINWRPTVDQRLKGFNWMHR